MTSLTCAITLPQHAGVIISGQTSDVGTTSYFTTLMNIRNVNHLILQTSDTHASLVRQPRRLDNVITNNQSVKVNACSRKVIELNSYQCLPYVMVQYWECWDPLLFDFDWANLQHSKEFVPSEIFATFPESGRVLMV